MTFDGSCEDTYIELYWVENESDIASRWAYSESNLMSTLASDKYQTKKSAIVHCELTVMLNISKVLRMESIEM